MYSSLNFPFYCAGGRNILSSICLIIVTTALSACSNGGSSGAEYVAGNPSSEIHSSSPAVSRWQQNLSYFGNRYCNEQEIREHQTWEGGVWYYDGARVYYQAADFTQSPNWEQCAEYVLRLYRSYVLTNNGNIPGWRVFPHGLAEHFIRTGDRQSREAVLLLAQRSPFASKAGGSDPELSRETAYLIHAYLLAQDLGVSSVAGNLSKAVDFALGHLRAWAETEETEYVKPFMVGLTLEALIAYQESSQDQRILPAVQRAIDWLWENGWNKGSNSFPYIICRAGARNAECLQNTGEEAPDLNLLVAPAFAWVYYVTGQPRYATQGDEIFSAGVRGADLNSGKRFSQSYRWSPQYLNWRFGIQRADALGG